MKKLAAILTSLSILSCTGFLTYAETTSVTASFDPATGIISLSGSAVGTTTVRVTTADTEIESLSDDNMPTDIHQIISGGTLDYRFRLPSGSGGGRYVISVTDKNGTADDTVFYFDRDSAADVADTYLNNSLSETAFVNTVLEHAGDLGIDTEYEDFSNECLSLMYRLSSSYKDYDTFYDNYKLCRAVSSLNNKNAEGVENCLKKYEDILGINYSECYENNPVLTADVKAELCELLSDMDYSEILAAAENITDKTGFFAVFEALSALAAVNDSESWKGLEKTYTSDFGFLNNNVVLKNSNYKAMNAQNVFGDMLKKEFNEISDLKDNFDSVVKALAKTDTSRTSSGGGGGGGGGSSYSVPHRVSDEKYDEIPGNIPGEEAFSIKMPALEEKYAEYTDVNNSDWFYLPVSVLGGNGIVNGYSDGSFHPLDNITRAEFTKLIVSAFSVTGKKTSFSDVSEDDWYSGFVSAAAGGGIVLGDDGYFHPNDCIIRQDAVVILYRIAALLNMPYEGFGYNFSDMDDISLYALPAVGALNKNGVVNGVGNGRFMPMSNLTRAEAVQLIHNVIKDIKSRS